MDAKMSMLTCFFKNIKLKHKLLVSYSVIIIIPVVVLGLFSYIQAKNFLRQQAIQGLQSSVGQMAANIDGKIKSCNSVMDFIALNTRVLDIINKDYESKYDLYMDYNEFMDPFFNSILFMNSDIKKIVIYTGNNIPERGIAEEENTIPSSISVLSIDRLKKEKWFDDTMKNGGLKWYRDKGKTFAVRRLVKQYKNSKPNIAYMELDEDKVFNILQNSEFKKFGIYICDNKMQVLFSHSSINLFQNINGKVLSESLQGNVKVDGVDCSLVKTEMPELAWTLYYYTPIASITFDAGSIISATIIIIACCVIVLFLITWLFSMSFVKRINRLNDKMDIIEEGCLNIEVHSQYGDEIGELTNKFGKMIKRINILVDELVYSKTVQKEAELKALQAQINPHFLYNSLSLINWKAKMVDAVDISDIALMLSKFYRTMLNKGNHYILIRDEIENTKAYIGIQQVMHDYSFDVIYDIDKEIYEYYMLNITLQPIVENAIEHGILNKRNSRGRLTVTGTMQDCLIQFTVEDNGSGMDEELIEHIFYKTCSQGYGLKNVQDRIRLYFGENYGLYITSEKGIGTTVKVILPKYKNV
jgi:Predicted signal transduction protein with a C-terminal ATPase domain